MCRHPSASLWRTRRQAAVDTAPAEGTARSNPARQGDQVVGTVRILYNSVNIGSNQVAPSSRLTQAVSTSQVSTMAAEGDASVADFRGPRSVHVLPSRRQVPRSTTVTTVEMDPEINKSNPT
jgi:hypothetical protein